MVKRTSPRRTLDDATFPIRIALQERDGAEWLTWSKPEAWLRENIGPGEYAKHGIPNHRPSAMGVYLRSIEAAQLFLQAFPDLKLADSTDTVDHLRQARRPTPHDSRAAFWACLSPGMRRGRIHRPTCIHNLNRKHDPKVIEWRGFSTYRDARDWLKRRLNGQRNVEIKECGTCKPQGAD